MSVTENSKRALIVWGGWPGHLPEQVAELFTDALKAHGFEVEVSDTLDVLTNAEKLQKLSLFVPIWSMGAVTSEQIGPLITAVRGGLGIAGCHGGMCDSFRNETEYQFMTGGQFVAHPGNDGTEFTVRITNRDHFITQESPPELR